ncbi:hypothetical protein RGQ29_025981 [Quercus rubra]|uniref:Pentatricopeptide repeat-containing protein n=1 Tax=Quercus rubra TaxID=3512 RepID=A0AAN7EZA7_QUERU|nr:hypothetical protein RGQ29_025981 [Quercus rubra]
MDEIQMGLPQTRLPTSLLGFPSPLSLQNPNPPKPIFRIPHICPQPCGHKPTLIYMWKGMSTTLLHLGSSIHSSVIKNSELDINNQDSTRSALVVWSSLLFMYSKCGELSNAVKLFDHMHVKDTVSWKTAMSGF